MTWHFLLSSKTKNKKQKKILTRNPKNQSHFNKKESQRRDNNLLGYSFISTILSPENSNWRRKRELRDESSLNLWSLREIRLNCQRRNRRRKVREKEKKKEKFKTVDIIFHTTVCAGSARDLGACDFYIWGLQVVSCFGIFIFGRRVVFTRSKTTVGLIN